MFSEHTSQPAQDFSKDSQKKRVLDQSPVGTRGKLQSNLARAVIGGFALLAGSPFGLQPAKADEIEAAPKSYTNLAFRDPTPRKHAGSVDDRALVPDEGAEREPGQSQFVINPVHSNEEVTFVKQALESSIKPQSIAEVAILNEILTVLPFLQNSVSWFENMFGDPRVMTATPGKGGFFVLHWIPDQLRDQMKREKIKAFYGMSGALLPGFKDVISLANPNNDKQSIMVGFESPPEEVRNLEGLFGVIVVEGSTSNMTFINKQDIERTGHPVVKLSPRFANRMLPLATFHGLFVWEGDNDLKDEVKRCLGENGQLTRSLSPSVVRRAIEKHPSPVVVSARLNIDTIANHLTPERLKETLAQLGPLAERETMKQEIESNGATLSLQLESPTEVWLIVRDTAGDRSATPNIDIAYNGLIQPGVQQPSLKTLAGSVKLSVNGLKQSAEHTIVMQVLDDEGKVVQHWDSADGQQFSFNAESGKSYTVRIKRFLQKSQAQERLRGMVADRTTSDVGQPKPLESITVEQAVTERINSRQTLEALLDLARYKPKASDFASYGLDQSGKSIGGYGRDSDLPRLPTDRLDRLTVERAQRALRNKGDRAAQIAWSMNRDREAVPKHDYLRRVYQLIASLTGRSQEQLYDSAAQQLITAFERGKVQPKTLPTNTGLYVVTAGRQVSVLDLKLAGSLPALETDTVFQISPSLQVVMPEGLIPCHNKYKRPPRFELTVTPKPKGEEWTVIGRTQPETGWVGWEEQELPGTTYSSQVRQPVPPVPLAVLVKQDQRVADFIKNFQKQTGGDVNTVNTNILEQMQQMQQLQQQWSSLSLEAQISIINAILNNNVSQNNNNNTNLQGFRGFIQGENVQLGEELLAAYDETLDPVAEITTADELEPNSTLKLNKSWVAIRHKGDIIDSVTLVNPSKKTNHTA